MKKNPRGDYKKIYVNSPMTVCVSKTSFALITVTAVGHKILEFYAMYFRDLRNTILTFKIANFFWGSEQVKTSLHPSTPLYETIPRRVMAAFLSKYRFNA